MKKPHFTPISSNFTRSQKRTIEYIDQHYFIQFDCNSISFKLLAPWDEPAHGNIDVILERFQTILRIYNEKHFHKLKFNFYEWNTLDTTALSRLGSEIGKQFKNLRELGFQFFSCSGISETGLQHLISPISRHLKGLRTLSLFVTGSTRVNEKGANFMKTLLLKRVKNLSKLNLNFSGELIFTGEERYPFEADLLTHLKKLELADLVDYIQNKDTSNAALQICKSTRYCLRNLQQLVLINSNDYKIPILDIISLVFRRVRQLQVLYIGFIDEYLNGDQNKIREINAYMKKSLSKLRYLTVNFYRLNQTSIENLITMFGNTLPYLSELRGFTLSVDILEEMRDEDLLLIIDQICLHGKHLENLNLSFETMTNISGPGLNHATYAMSQHLIDLKELTLSFPCTMKKWNEDPAPLLSFSSLKRLHLYLPRYNFGINLSGCHEHLEELTLLFMRCDEMSGGQLEELIASLFNLEFKRIRQFNLLFATASKIKDEDIRMLCFCIRICMKNLKEFTFGISNAKTITDCALSYITHLIKTQLKSVSTLKLSFRDSRSLTENGVKKLSRTIVENIKQLNDLELDFPEVTISEEAVDLIVTEIVVYAKKLKKIQINFASNSEDYDFIRKMRKKLSFIPVVDFYYIFHQF